MMWYSAVQTITHCTPVQTVLNIDIFICCVHCIMLSHHVTYLYHTVSFCSKLCIAIKITLYSNCNTGTRLNASMLVIFVIVVIIPPWHWPCTSHWCRHCASSLLLSPLSSSTIIIVHPLVIVCVCVCVCVHALICLSVHLFVCAFMVLCVDT